MNRLDIKNWKDIPPSHLDVLTFQDLKVGDRFISFPAPGDNDGHGGFKGTFNVFIKTKEKISGYAKNSPHGEVKREDDGVCTSYSYSTPVIKISDSPKVHIKFIDQQNVLNQKCGQIEIRLNKNLVSVVNAYIANQGCDVAFERGNGTDTGFITVILKKGDY
jgi:hypothetical protein